MSFVLKDQVRKVTPLGGEIELCGSSICLGGECWRNSDFANVSVEWWIFDMSVKCFFCSMVQGVAVSVYYCEIFKFYFLGVLQICGGFWWHWWFDFYALKLILSGTCWFYLCILLCSCWLDISSGRLYKFSEHLEFDLLDTWLKTW